MRISQVSNIRWNGSLKGGDFNLYESSIDNITATISKIIESSHNKNNSDNISSFLLSLCGILGGQVVKNQENDKVELSYRLINSFCIIDETRIISVGSPIYANNIYTRTLEKSVFNFIITGRDASDLITYEKPQIISAQNSARLEVFDNLIHDLEKRIGEYPYDEIIVSAKINELDMQINTYTESLNSVSLEIHHHQIARKDAWNKQQKIENRLSAIEGLLKRFDLLKEQYISDLNRLDFISEGDHFFNQLEYVNCPLCNTPLSEHVKNLLCDEKAEELIDIQTACEEEARKIKILISDLEKTVNSLTNEQTTLTPELDEQIILVKNEDEIIQNVLSPQVISIKDKIQENIDERQKLYGFELDKKRLQELWFLRSSTSIKDLTAEKSIKGKRKQNKPQYDMEARRELCNIIANTLRSWKYVEEGIVEFSDDWDLIINGKVRSSHGKGVRALLFTSFTYSLMEFCNKKSLSHPMTIVIDSPLTTFREDQKREDEDEISGKIQTAFFETLSRCDKNEQIIILDNKEPPRELWDTINFIQFSGNPNSGRKGFLL